MRPWWWLAAALVVALLMALPRATAQGARRPGDPVLPDKRNPQVRPELTRLSYALVIGGRLYDGLTRKRA